MAGSPASLPSSYTGASASDCLQCATLRNLLSQCGTCGSTSAGGGGAQQSCPPGYSFSGGVCAPNPLPTGAQQDGCPAGFNLQNGVCAPNPPPGAPASTSIAGCPAGDVASSNGSCPLGYAPDTMHPGCCSPSVPAASGQQGAQQTQAVEACFICPGGLSELTSALSGQPNGCYLSSQMFFAPGAALPPPT